MNNLLGRRVAFIPCFMYKKEIHEAEGGARPVKGVIDYVHKRHGWFSAAYLAGDTVQHECFKECDIGTAVTLLGHKKNC